MDDSATNVRLRATVEGRVQGVGFRYFTFKVAQELALTGWVRNTYDGNVQVLAEGPRPALERLLFFLRKGPPSSYVTNVSTYWDNATGEFSNFEITATL
jgi:acylphosphatase